MSQITTILDAFVTRCGAIAGVNTPVKLPRIFAAENELPGIAIYRGATELIENRSTGPAQLELPVTVDYYRAQNGAEDPSERAETMINEILAKVETGDGTMDGALCEPVYAQSDGVLLPETPGGVIRATVVFTCPLYRQYGGGS